MKLKWILHKLVINKETAFFKHDNLWCESFNAGQTQEIIVYGRDLRDTGNNKLSRKKEI